MIRVILYDKNVSEARNLRRIIGGFSEGLNIYNIGISITDSYERFIDVVRKAKPGFFDMAIVRVSVSGDAIIAKLRAVLDVMKTETPKTDVIVLSDDSNHAYNAYQVGARFLKTPFDESAFSRTIGATLFHIAAVAKHPFPIKSGKSIMVMNLNDIMFAETSKQGPIIHLPKGRTIAVKGTLQALYERLHVLDERFLRAGGSFIVNLDNIRTADGDSVIFANGEAIILPVRFRKAVNDAVDSLRERSHE